MPKSSKPELPDTADWPEQTLTWFDSWRDSPRTDSWDDSQWQYLIDTALVHAEIWGSGNTAMMGELRSRESYMGLTFDARPIKKETGKKSVIQLVCDDRAKKAKRVGA